MKKLSSEITPSWEDKFFEEFTVGVFNRSSFKDDFTPQDIIDFISSLLAQQEQEFEKTLNSGRKMYELGKKDGAKALKAQAERVIKELKKQSELSLDEAQLHKTEAYEHGKQWGMHLGLTMAIAIIKKDNS